GRGRIRSVLVEIEAGLACYLRRGREIDDGLGALVRRDGEELGGADGEGHPAAGLIAEAGGHEAGVEAIGGHARAREAARQRPGEEDIAELGTAVGLE